MGVWGKRSDGLPTIHLITNPREKKEKRRMNGGGQGMKKACGSRRKPWLRVEYFVGIQPFQGSLPL